MVVQPISIRKSLLSLNPETQEQTAASLGHTAPHRELPLIESTLRSDLKGTQRLTTRTVKRLCNATMHHLSSIPLLSPHAAVDIIAKAHDVYRAAGHWAMEHFNYSQIMDYLLCLREELEILGAFDLAAEESEVAA